MRLAFNKISFALSATLLLPGLALAEGAVHKPLDLTASGVGFAAIIIFLVAYLLVMAEEFTHLRKSKPVIIAAGIMWHVEWGY